MCRTLPLLASHFEKYDAQGHLWVIVSWTGTNPNRVTLDVLEYKEKIETKYGVLSNTFTSRTSALRKNADICRDERGGDEANHMGVWAMRSTGTLCFQTVLPLEVAKTIAPKPQIVPPAPKIEKKSFSQVITTAVSSMRQIVKHEPLPVIPHSQSQNLQVQQNQNVSNVEFTRPLFKSRQESEFFQALRQVYPRYDVYPNVALSCLIDFDAIQLELSSEERRYFFMGIVDCVVFDQFRSYRPLYFFELDSSYHDTPEQRTKDRYKERILALAGQKLYRIRKVDRPVGIDGFVTMIREVLNEPEPNRTR